MQGHQQVRKQLRRWLRISGNSGILSRVRDLGFRRRALPFYQIKTTSNIDTACPVCYGCRHHRLLAAGTVPPACHRALSKPLCASWRERLHHMHAIRVYARTRCSVPFFIKHYSPSRCPPLSLSLTAPFVFLRKRKRILANVYTRTRARARMDSPVSPTARLSQRPTIQ